MRKANYFTKSELALFEGHKPVFDPSQMKIINRKTPDSEVEIKTDKSGFTYKSVKAAYVKALVTLVTGGNFCFEVVSREYIPSSKEVIVHGRLTIWLNGMTIKREQFGQHYLQLKTEVNKNVTTTYASDIGNGYKAAASDAFKKCASEFGFCWDIYGQEHADQKKAEIPEMNHADKKKLERLDHFLKQAATVSEVEHTYNKYLETAEETEASKDLLKKYLNLFVKSIEESK
ncbi:MAG: hypothetical protein PVG07_00050 [Acidobacteriota bacterium]|jgi:hypothetical protein